MAYKLPEDPKFLKKNYKAEVSDHRLLRVEYYNPNDFTIRIVRDTRWAMHVVNSNILLGNEVYFLKPREFIILPHQYWVMYAMNGAPTFPLIENFGAMIGKKNVLASRPPEY